jgi:hypothetical protein
MGALGAGSLPEELFDICYRGDCSTAKALRRRALSRITERGLPPTSSELLAAVERAFRRIGYVAKDVHNAVVREYAEVLRLDIPPRADVLRALGGREGWTFEELLYKSNSPVADALHEIIMALYMEYVDGGDVERLGIADYATYTIIELYTQGRLPKDKTADVLKQVADLVLK